jgi:hypothetical protein
VKEAPSICSSSLGAFSQVVAKLAGTIGDPSPRMGLPIADGTGVGEGTGAGGASRGYVPYRNSKLTHLLKEALGGDCKCLFFANLAPPEGPGTTEEERFGIFAPSAALQPPAKKGMAGSGNVHVPTAAPTTPPARHAQRHDVYQGGIASVLSYMHKVRQINNHPHARKQLQTRPLS